MKIIMVIGSPRTDGSTARIMRMIYHLLQKREDVEVQFINLSELEFVFCTGCSTCFQTGKCCIKDDLEKLSESLVLADGIILGSPTYASNVSGQLKTWIDRGHLIMEQGLYKKYAMGIVTGENYGSSSVTRILRNVFVFSGAYVTSMIKHKLPFAHTPSFTTKFIKRTEMMTDRFYMDIKTHHQYYIQKLFHYFIFNLGIKPFVIQKGKLYQGVVKSWEKRSSTSLEG